MWMIDTRDASVEESFDILGPAILDRCVPCEESTTMDYVFFALHKVSMRPSQAEKVPALCFVSSHQGAGSLPAYVFHPEFLFFSFSFSCLHVECPPSNVR